MILGWLVSSSTNLHMKINFSLIWEVSDSTWKVLRILSNAHESLSFGGNVSGLSLLLSAHHQDEFKSVPVEKRWNRLLNGLMSASDFPVEGTHTDNGYGIYMLIWSLSTLMLLKLVESFVPVKLSQQKKVSGPQTKTTWGCIPNLVISVTGCNTDSPPETEWH